MRCVLLGSHGPASTNSWATPNPIPSPDPDASPNFKPNLNRKSTTYLTPRRCSTAACGAPRPPSAAECLGRFWSLAPDSLRTAELRKLQPDQPLSLVCYLQTDANDQASEAGSGVRARVRFCSGSRGVHGVGLWQCLSKGQGPKDSCFRGLRRVATRLPCDLQRKYARFAGVTGCMLGACALAMHETKMCAMWLSGRVS